MSTAFKKQLTYFTNNKAEVRKENISIKKRPDILQDKMEEREGEGQWKLLESGACLKNVRSPGVLFAYACT